MFPYSSSSVVDLTITLEPLLSLDFSLMTREEPNEVVGDTIGLSCDPH